MALRVFHPCQFHFESQDIRVAGSTISGGTSLSGYEDVIRTDSGGLWVADFNDGDFGDRDNAGRLETLNWRSINAAMLGGSVAVVVQFCDGLHQPFLDNVPGLSSAVVTSVENGQAGGNRATIIDVTLTHMRPLRGGERFTHVHAAWGERAYEIMDVLVDSGVHRLTIQPPIRGGIAAGDSLDFRNVRCRMRRTSAPSNALSMGVFSSGSISFQEDMRPPA